MPSVVQSLTGGSVRHVRPIPRDHAVGTVREVYRALEREFALVPPLTILSPSPAILGGAWAAMREIFIVDPAHRAARETVASGVSLANTCSYCVDVHSAMLDASGQHALADSIRSTSSRPQSDPLLAWARATRDPGAAALAHPPFPSALAPQMLGTAVLFHFINRMVSIFVADSPAPVPLKSDSARNLFGRAFGAVIGKRLLKVRATPGASLGLLTVADLPREFAWAAHSPEIGLALGRFNAAIELEADQFVPPTVREMLVATLEGWNGEDAPIGRGWLEAALAPLIVPADRTCAELALLAALAPYRISDALVTDFRRHFPLDQPLVTTTAWASLAATRRIMSWVAADA